MGAIIHEPGDSSIQNDWALVSSGVVSNVISANLTFIQTIQSSYDFLVDITVGNQTAGIDYTYDSGQDTFTPPNEDYAGEMLSALVTAESDLRNALNLSGHLSSQDIQDVLNEARGDIQNGFTTNENDMWSAVEAWITSQG